MPNKKTDETSERKRVSIPKADQSVLEWWEAQHDPGSSVRLLIRNEIQKSGFVDTAYGRIEQVRLSD